MTPDHAGEPTPQAKTRQLPTPPSLGQPWSACSPPVSVRIKPPRNGYFPGERIEADIFGLGGERCGREEFVIQEYVSSGFAGQVYRAVPVNGVLPSAGEREETQTVAIKVLKPKNRWKRIFRDLLYYCSYQTSYAPRLREPAIRSGLIWQEVLRIAAEIEFGLDSAVARPLGYYWDSGQGSYVEVHEWVESRPVRYEADDRIFFGRNSGGRIPAETEMVRKKRFMQSLVKLCHQIGAVGLARQYEWFTLVSQANVLSRVKSESSALEFTGIDFRPGLAVPFFLPLSPVHLRIIYAGIRRGVLVHFDEVEFERLDRFVADQGSLYPSLPELCQRLKQDDQCYRSALPNLWHAGHRSITDTKIRNAIASGLIEDWRKLDKVTPETALRLERSRLGFFLFYLLGLLPLVGGFFQRIVGSSPYRHHLKNLAFKRAYFREVFKWRKSCDLLAWFADRRISELHLQSLTRSNFSYCFDKIVLSWLPARLHRLLSDGEVFRRQLFYLIVHPLRLLLEKEYRKTWLAEIIHQQYHRGIVNADHRDDLLGQLTEARMQAFIRDLGFTIGLEIFSKIGYALLAAYGFSSGNFVPLVVAALGPIPPSGIVRTVYVFALLVWELPGMIRQRANKLFLTRALGLLVAPWRMVGNLFAPLEMFAYYHDLSLLLADYYVSRMVAVIPVLGGRGQLLEYWAFQLVFNVPLSIRKRLLAR
jgi:hypothetical protein